MSFLVLSKSYTSLELTSSVMWQMEGMQTLLGMPLELRCLGCWLVISLHFLNQIHIQFSINNNYTQKIGPLKFRTSHMLH